MLRAMRSRVDAMVVMSPYADDERACGGAQAAARRWSCSAAAAMSAGHPRFAIDNHAGAFAMTAHLLDAGHRRIAFIAGPADNIEAAQRLARLSRRARRGRPARSSRSCRAISASDRAASPRGQLLAGPRPDAIFAANDMMAIGCLQALREAGLRVPDDIALAGFDDIPIARFVEPP